MVRYEIESLDCWLVEVQWKNGMKEDVFWADIESVGGHNILPVEPLQPVN